MPSTSHRMPDPLRRMLPMIAVAVWCSIIFWFSHQPDLSVSDDDTIDFIVRKAAHMAEYGALLLLVLWLLATTFGMRARPLRNVLAFAFVLAYAASDEYHQTFVDGRVGLPRDVAIDMAGAIVTFGLYRIYTKGAPLWRRPRT